ncbi:TapY2 family type IVa secretion system protein [Shewanella cyperi]|uniref:TapY2 family type IVa secretion system protein n=1 Tax=Shewanella cyperi TaxID=2814292 RepID=A0A975ALX8_9GAMM|nr:TapY2 family type IVa secretion system protein [Shewanella cyperi]QSX30872.1 TapY2 family type IVa secretion system protein [Shewanella cyperi]
MNNFSLRMIVGTSLILSSVAFADGEAYQDYKCYVKTSGQDRVVFYSWQSSKVEVKMKALSGSQLTDKKGKKFYIKDPVECVLLSEKFTSAKAQELDSKTLR